ncbi:MAG: choice-of-anchor D domain-containing protein, partial [Blastocatellia bacterium]|nr:choice-of-anchor D domain-containing protein [Blastocatellia bacterium]
MKRLRSKYALLGVVSMIAALSLAGLQVVRADWVHRLFHRTGLALSRVWTGSPEAKSLPQQQTIKRTVDVATPTGALTSEPVAAVLADLNADGRSELIVAHANSVLSVRAGQARGTFGAPTSFSLEARPSALAAGDVTGDGHVDIVIADAQSPSLLILVGDGKGGLPQAQRVVLSGIPSQVVVKDFMGDVGVEVVTAVSNQGGTQLLIWSDLGQGRTLELSPNQLAVPFQEAVSRLEVGYFDADSYVDIFVAGQEQMAVLFGNSSAPFERAKTLPLETELLDSVVGDFNGDARTDVAVLDSATRHVLIYSANEAGQWGVRERLNAAANRLAVADIDNDRVADLIAVRTAAEQVAIYHGARQGSMNEVVNPIDGQPVYAVAGYLDKDNRMDVVVLKQEGLSLLLTGPEDSPSADSPITAIDPLEYDIQVPEGECRTVPIRITIVPTVFRPLDIYLLVDSSNSFSNNLTQFLQSSDRFVDDLLALRSGNIRLGLGTFIDYPIQPFGELLDYAYRREIDLTPVDTSTRTRLINAFRNVRPRGGGDLPESQLPALFQAATGAGQFEPCGRRRANIDPDQQANFMRDVDVEKIIVLITDATFHEAGDPGTCPYPGPSFADTMAALNQRGIKVVGIAVDGGSTPPAQVTAALRRIAEATNTRAKGPIDCDGNGTIDIPTGAPIVCPPSGNVALKDVILRAVRGFDLPVPLTLEVDRDCSPATFMIDPPVQFVNPLTGGTFVFNVTWCCPCPSAPGVCRFETKVILDEIIRARIPSRVECVRPVCEVSPASIDFGDVCVGQNAERTITIRSTGNGSFTVTQLVSNNPAFTVVSTSVPLPRTLAPGQSMTARVRFNCADGGPQSGVINIVTDPASSCTATPLCAPVAVSGFCVNITPSVAPTSLDFGDVCVGQSATRVFRVRNVPNPGARDFTINTVTSNNPAFTVTPSGPVTVEVGRAVNFTVTFNCTAPGPQSGTIRFTTSNAANCPLDLGTVSVSGTCLRASVTVAPTSLDFGDVCVGQSADRTFTVTNTGNTPVTIDSGTVGGAFTIVTALPVTIAPGASATITVRMRCTSPGAQSGTVALSASSVCGPVSVASVSLTGFCVTVSGNVDPALINIGDVCVGQTADRTFVVNNTGNRPFTINTITSNSPAISVVGPALPINVPAGGSVTVTIRLTCTSPGVIDATISLGVSSICGPVDVGTVRAKAVCINSASEVVPTSLDFGTVCVGQSADRTFAIRSVGNRPFRVTSITSNNPAFTIVSPALPADVPEGATGLVVTVRFTCTTAGAQTGTISTSATGPCGPVAVAPVSVSGTCQVASGAVSPTTLNFGDVCVGQSADRTFTVTNTGNLAFTINSITSNNPSYSIVSPTLPATVPVGGSVTVTVRLRCTSPGVQAGTLAFDASSACGAVALSPVSLTGNCVVATGDVNPRALDFGAVCVGQSADRTFVVSNTGTTPFTINSVSVTGPFAVVSPALPVNVAVGGSVTITVRLNCTSAGAQSGTVSFSATSACGPVALGTVSLSGTCISITGDVSPRTIAFGEVCVGSSADRSFTVTNTGNGSFTITAVSIGGAYSLVSPALPVTIPAGGSQDFTVRLTCTSAGVQNATVSFTTSSACGPVALGTVALTGTCIQATGDITPRAIDFGAVCVGQSAERTFVISNTGNTPFRVNAIVSNNPAFTIVSPALPITIAVGGSATVTVRLTCTSPGMQTGTLAFDATSVCTSVSLGSVSLTGTCLQVAGDVAPRTLDYGDVCVGQSADRTFVVSNLGNTPFTINAINVTGPFAVVSPALPVNVPVGGNVAVTVRFSCATGGAQGGVVSFQTTSACGPVSLGTVTLRGFCVAITCAVAPSTLSFGNVCVGQSADRSFTIRNTGSRDLTITAVASTNPAFVIVGPALPITISAGESADVTVRFRCTAPGPQSGTINITTTTVCGPVVCASVSVTGVCLQTTGDVAPRAIDFGTVCVGQSADRTFTVTNTGNTPFNLTAINSNNPAFTVVSPTLPAPVPVGGSVTVTVRFRCTTRGAVTGTLTFDSTSECGPAAGLGSVSLTGFCAEGGCALSGRSLDFGEVLSPGAADQTVILSNTGNVPLTVSAVTSNNPAFTVVQPVGPVTVAPGEDLLVTIRFSCAGGASGVQTGVISITASTVCGPVNCGQIGVRGECFVDALCRVPTANINFGDVLARDCITGGSNTADRTLTICNDGDRPLNVTAIRIDNPRFTVVGPLPGPIAPGQCANVTLRFEARELGPQTAVAVIESNARNPAACRAVLTGNGIVGPQCIFVQPLGTPPDFNFDLPFPDVVIGGTTTENGLVQVLNSGDQPLVINEGGRRPDVTNLSFTVLGWDLDGIIPPLEFPLNPNPAVPAPEITIAPGDSIFMLVRFTGLDIGSQVGAIRLFTNECTTDPNNPPCVLKTVRGNVV